MLMSISGGKHTGNKQNHTRFISR